MMPYTFLPEDLLEQCLSLTRAMIELDDDVLRESLLYILNDRLIQLEKMLFEQQIC